MADVVSGTEVVSGTDVVSETEVVSGAVELSCVDSSVEEASEAGVSLTSAFCRRQ